MIIKFLISKKSTRKTKNYYRIIIFKGKQENSILNMSKSLNVVMIPLVVLFSLIISIRIEQSKNNVDTKQLRVTPATACRD